MTARRPPPTGRVMRLAFRPAGNARLLSPFSSGVVSLLNSPRRSQTTFKKERTMQHRNTYIPRFRISLVRETRGTYTEQKLSSSADADRLLRPMLQDLDREHFIVIGLDAGRRHHRHQDARPRHHRRIRPVQLRRQRVPVMIDDRHSESEWSEPSRCLSTRKDFLETRRLAPTCCRHHSWGRDRVGSSPIAC